MILKVGQVSIIPIRTGEGECLTLTLLRMPPGVRPSNPVRITCHRVLLNHALTNDVYTTTSFVADVKNVCGAITIGAIIWSIPGLIVMMTAEMVRLLNIFFKFSGVSVSNCFIPVSSMSNCFCIACKITFIHNIWGHWLSLSFLRLPARPVYLASDL